MIGGRPSGLDAVLYETTWERVRSVVGDARIDALKRELPREEFEESLEYARDYLD
jgi:hypothetical protein